MSRWAFVHCLQPPPSPHPTDLAQQLYSLSSMVALGPQGVWLESSGSAGLWKGEKKLAQRAQQLAQQVGYRAAVAIADNHETARLLAPTLPAPHRLVVPPGHDQAALAPLPLTCLEPSATAQTYLLGLGIRHLGQLGRFSPTALARRLGPPGDRFVRVARAESLPRPSLYRPPHVPQAERELEPPLPVSEAIIFIVKSVLDELSSTLAGRGLALSSLRLILTFEGGQERVEDVSLARPLRSPAPLVAILQERLLGQPDEGEDSWPPRLARIEALALNTAHPAPSQLTLFGPQELNHEKMTTLLARLTTTLGEKRVFTSELVSSHRPEAAWQAQRATFGGSRRQAKPAAPTAETHINIPEPSSPRPVFLLTPPRPLQGELTPGSRLRWEQGRGILRFCWGPERLRGQWWDQPFDRDYFVVDLHDGSRLWIYRDRTSKELFLQGVFD